MTRSEPIEQMINDAEPQLRHPGVFARKAVRDLRTSGGLARRLLGLALRARYRQSVLGYVWLLAMPVSIAAVWVFLHRSGVVSFSATRIPYAVHVTTGVFLWTAFLRFLNSPLQQLQGNRPVLSKIGFPWEALILAGWGEALVEMAAFLFVLVLVYLFFGLSLLGIVAAIPAIAALLALGGGIGLFLAPFGILYEDVPRAVGIATYLLFFLTPIIYPVPVSMPALITVIGNPVAMLLVTSREVMTGQGVTFPALALATGAGSIALLLAGWILFRLSIPHLVSKL